MFNPYTNRFTQFIVPLFMFALGIVATSQLETLSAAWLSVVLQGLPVIILGVALFLSLQFNRSRYGFALLFLSAAAALAVYFKDVVKDPAYTLSMALIMINLLVFSFFKDRSVFSIHGILRLILIAIQVGLIYYLHSQFTEATSSYLHYELFSLPESWEAVITLPDSLLLLSVVLIVLHLAYSLYRANSAAVTFMGCQLCLLGIICGYDTALTAPLLTSAAGLMICIAILMDSHDMAYRDELTKLPSRRALNQLLLSVGRKYTIAMMDIDHFKKFNDTHGHDIGDEVLQMVASKIAKVTGGGKPFRYGGEEFTVVFPNRSPDQAEAHLEALRKTIENYKMVVRDKQRPKNEKKNKAQKSKRGKGGGEKTLSVTISIGLAEKTKDIKTPEQVIKAADDALYRAKKGGRNCVSR